MRLHALTALALVIAIGLAACGEASSSNTAHSSAVYLSLGDSVAAGNGASDPQSASFAALVARERGFDLVNLAVAGDTTRDVIDGQLPQAAELASSREVALITISAGGNDLAALIPNASCVEDPLPDSCPLDAALDDVSARFAEILLALRTSYPATPIVLLAYPNFFSGTGHAFEAPAARVLPRLGDRLRELAANHSGVTVASPSFDRQGGELTHVLDEQFDPHPNDAGHQVIAAAVLDALAAAE